MKRISKQKHSRFLSRIRPSSSVSSSSSLESPTLPDKSLFIQLQSGDPQEQESATSLLMNISLDISNKQMDMLFQESVLSRLMGLLAMYQSSQLTINIVSVFLRLAMVEANHKNFTKTISLIDAGLLEMLSEIIKRVFGALSGGSLLLDLLSKNICKEILRKTSNLMSFYCESMERGFIEKRALSFVEGLVEIGLQIEDEAIFIDILDLVHILTEFSEGFRASLCSNKSFLTRMEQVLMVKTHNSQSASILTAKGYIIGILSHLAITSPVVLTPIKEEISQFLLEVLKTPFMSEVMKILSGFTRNKGENDVMMIEEEEEREKCPKVMKKVIINEEETKQKMSILVDFSRAIEISLMFLHNLLERDEFEDEESLEDFDDEEEEGLMLEKDIKNEDGDMKNEHGNKQETMNFKDEMLVFLEKCISPGFFFNLISENLLISPQDVAILASLEAVGFETLTQSAYNVNYLSIAVLSAAFENTNTSISQSKAGFLGFLWKKLEGLSELLLGLSTLLDMFEIFVLILRKVHSILESSKNNPKEYMEFREAISTEGLLKLLITLESLSSETVSEPLSLTLNILALRFPITGKPIEEPTLLRILETLKMSLGVENGLVVASSLNAIYDIFADENYDTILGKSGLIKLCQSVDTIKLRKGVSKKNKAFIKETEENLSGFIKYKQEHGVC